MKIVTTDAEANEQLGNLGDADDAKLDELVNLLMSDKALTGFQLHPLDFEKVDNSNHHIDFIPACSNLCATNYSIEPAYRHVSKRIREKIIPPITTTTAFVIGMVCMELYKLVMLGVTDISLSRSVGGSAANCNPEKGITYAVFHETTWVCPN